MINNVPKKLIIIKTQVYNKYSMYTDLIMINNVPNMSSIFNT